MATDASVHNITFSLSGPWDADMALLPSSPSLGPAQMFGMVLILDITELHKMEQSCRRGATLLL